jgi:hypothetical protein
VLDAAQSAQGLELVLTTQIPPSNLRIFHLRLGSHKERLGFKRLLKSYASGQKQATHERGGGVPFIGIWKTSRWSYQIRPVYHIGQTGWVTPTGSGYSLKEIL